MKSLTHKLLAFTFVIALAAGCGSVTDAGLDTDQPDTPDTEQVSPDTIDEPGFGSDSDMSTIVDEPEEE
jgi:hypothetical protein